MGANLEIAGPVKRTEQGNVDYYYGGGDYAWPNKAAAVAGVPLPVRPGKIVGVVESGKVAEYIWHPDNTTDDGLTKVVTGDAGTVRTVPAGVSFGSIKRGDQVPLGTNVTNAAAFEKLITAPAAPVYTSYTIYATTVNINTLTAMILQAQTSGWECNIKLVSEMDGGKQRFWLPVNLTIGSVQFYNPEAEGFIAVNSLGNFSKAALTVSGVDGYQYTSTDPDRGNTIILIKSNSGSPVSYVAAGYVAAGYFN